MSAQDTPVSKLPPIFADIVKFNKELLDDDFNAKHDLVIKTKSKGSDKVTELSSTYKQKNPTESAPTTFDFEGKFKTTTGKVEQEGSVKQDGSASFEVKYNLADHAAGLKAIASGTAYTSWAAKKNPFVEVGLQYINAKTYAQLLINPRSFYLKTTFMHLPWRNVLFGANIGLEAKTVSLDRLEWALVWQPANQMFVGLVNEVPPVVKTGESPLGNALKLVLWHQANADQTVGSEFRFDQQKKSVAARLGFHHKFNKETSGKFSVNDQGHVQTALKHTLNEWITASVATSFDVRTAVAESKAQQFPLRVQLDLKF